MGCLGTSDPTACPSACLGSQDPVADGCSVCTFLWGLSLPPPAGSSQGCPSGAQGSPRAEQAAPGRAGGPAVSWGNWVVLGTAKSCTVTCPGLAGDSRTGGYQVAQWSTAPVCSQCSAPADTLGSPGSWGVLSTAVSLSGMGPHSGTVWTGTPPSRQCGAARSQPAGGVGRCLQACQCGQAPAALGCSVVLLGPVQLRSPAALQTLVVLTPEL